MNISSAVHSALTTRLKLISGMNIAEKRIPQDGRFTQVVDGTTLDVRVSYGSRRKDSYPYPFHRTDRAS